MMLPPPSLPDPLDSRFNESWFEAKNAELQRLKEAQEAKAAKLRRYAVVSSGVLVAAIPVAMLGLPIVTAVARIVWALWLVVPGLWIASAVSKGSKKSQRPVEDEIARARLWEALAQRGRDSRAAGRPSEGGTDAFVQYGGHLVAWHGIKNFEFAFTPDHPFWKDPVEPDWDVVWERLIADPNAFLPESHRLVAQSRARYDAWYAALPNADRHTYMAIEQLRHQRKMEAEAHTQTQAAQAAAASAAAAAHHAAVTARNTAAIANNTAVAAQNSAIIANNTAAIANGVAAQAAELEWQRRHWH